MSGSPGASPGTSTGSSFATGTLTRPFGRNPQSLVPPSPPPSKPQDQAPDSGSRRSGSRLLVSAAKDEDRDAWWHKQVEIRELQEVNRSLLKRVTSHTPSAASTPQVQRTPPSSARPDQMASPIWPLPMPISKQPPGSSAGGLTSFLPAEQMQAQGLPRKPSLESRRPPSLKLVAENRKLSEDIAALQMEVLDLRQNLSDRTREIKEKSAKGEQLSESLRTAEQRTSELGDELEKLQAAKQMLEQLEGNSGAAQKAVVNYIDKDLVSMRAERKNLEALHRTETQKLEEQIEQLRVESQEACSAKDLAENKLQAVRGEQEAAKAAALGAVKTADEAVEEQQQQIFALEHALQDLQNRQSSQEQQIRDHQAAAKQAEYKQQELQANLSASEQQVITLSQLEGQIESHEMTLAAERSQRQQDQEQHSASLVEERKKLKREAAKKNAELQARHEELLQEVEEANSKAKETEKTMHSKLSSLRQERQKTESKLKNQLQGVQAECLAHKELSQESQEAAAQHREMAGSVQKLRSELASQEVECADLQEQLIRDRGSQLHEKEVLLQELAEASRECSLLEKESAEQSVHIKVSDDELARLRQELQGTKGLAEELQEHLDEESRSASSLRADLEEARTDANSSLEQHEELLEALRREQQAADNQLQSLLREAADKQRKLGHLEEGLATEEVPLLNLLGFGEAHDAPEKPEKLPAAASALFDWGATGTSSSSSRREVLPPLSPASRPAASPQNVSSLRLVAAAGGVGHGVVAEPEEGVNSMLRALTREQEAHRVQALGEEITTLLNSTAQAMGVGLHDGIQRKLHELLAHYNQAVEAATEDQLRHSDMVDQEAALRSQLEVLEEKLRVGADNRKEKNLRVQELEVEVDRLRADLEQARNAGNNMETAHKLAEKDFAAQKAVNTEANEKLIADLRREVMEARRHAAEENNLLMNSLNNDRAKLEAQAAITLEQQLELAHEDKLVFKDELREFQRTIQSGLKASADESAAIRRQPNREAKLEAQLKDLRSDREEAMQEFRAAQKAEANCLQEMETFKVEAKKERRKDREDLEHERDLLAAELQQFQDEHLLLDQKLYLAEERKLPELRALLEEKESAVQQEHRKGLRSLRNHQRQSDEREFELQKANDALREEHIRITLDMKEMEKRMNAAKDQLHKAREDNMKDRQKLERQIEKLKQEIKDHKTGFEALEKEKSHVELGARGNKQEMTAQIQKHRSHSSKLAADLQLAEEQVQSFEHVASKLGTSQSLCQELQAAEAALMHEKELLHVQLARGEDRAQAAETWGQELARRLQEAEGLHRETREEVEIHRNHCGRARDEANSINVFASRLLKAVAREARQLVAFASGNQLDEVDEDGSVAELEQAKSLGEEPEALVNRAFTALHKTLAALSRESAELRATAAASPAAPLLRRRASGFSVSEADVSSSSNGAQSAQLQKELIKLREQNQELEVERKRLASLLEGSGGALGPSKPSEVPKPVQMEASSATSELKQKLRQLQQAKAKAESQAEVTKQELTKISEAHHQDLDRLQIEIEEQQQSFHMEQDQLQKKLLAAEKKNRLLEAKLKGRAENERALVAEKEAVEEQLGIAAKQLEALLLDETKDSDLQRDLAALSKQFEQLHLKHRTQLAKAVEQGKQLQQEQAARHELEEQLRATQRQTGELEASIPEKLRLEKELRELRAEQAVSAQETSRLQRAEQRFTAASEEVKRLQEELSQVRGSAVASQDSLQRLRQQEEELQQVRSQLQQSEAARRQLEGDIRQLRLPSEAATSSQDIGRFGSAPEEAAPSTVPSEDRGPQLPVNGVRVRTANEKDAPGVAPPSSGDIGLLKALEEIQETLSARELALEEHKTSAATAQEPLEKANGKAAPNLAEMERDFGEFARSMGFNGDVKNLWEEAQAQAQAQTQTAAVAAEASPPIPRSRREVPVAADIQLTAAPGSGVKPPSPPRRGVPSSKSSSPSGYPASPGREERSSWQDSSASEVSSEGSPQEHRQSKSRGGPLPAAAQETFQQAEVLCQRQRFAEAVPLFQRTLEILEEAGISSQAGSPAAAVAAEVWAHLGVAMQSLDRVPDAIESYKRAVALDTSLHVCLANLATLHAYLNDRDRAMEYIARAVELDPRNPTYAQLRSQFETSEESHQAEAKASSTETLQEKTVSKEDDSSKEGG